MKAAYILQPGPPESIRYGDLPDPTPHSDQVLVRTLAVSVNFIDTFIRGGAYSVPLPSPFVIGRDVVGTVEAVGASVKDFVTGDLVWANNQGYAGRQGTFAELLTIEQKLLYRLPREVEPLAGVASLHSLLTVATGLLGKASLRPGESLFLRGGSGNVGLAAIQVARRLGCRVITTAGSEESADWCRKLGAERVIRYHHESLDQALLQSYPDGANVTWDLTPSPDLELAVRHTARRGRILLSSGLNCTSALPIGQFYTRNQSLLGFTVTDLEDGELAAHAQTINEYLPGMQARIERVLPLSQASQAHQMMAGKLEGKLVLTPDSIG